MTLFLSAMAAAAETGGAPEAASGGLPQFDPTVFGPQIIWLVITFAVFYFVMAKLVLPRIGDVLEDREEKIADDLDQAEQLSQEAGSVQDTFEGSLTEARSQSTQIIASARSDAQDRVNSELAKLDTKLGKQADKAEERIAAEKASALEELEAVATDACEDIIAKLLGSPVDQNAIRDIVKQEISGRGV
ncbi:MAG: F0F1 ATP synthase subunit B [Pseudomonadota bacterium]